MKSSQDKQNMSKTDYSSLRKKIEHAQQAHLSEMKQSTQEEPV